MTEEKKNIILIGGGGHCKSCIDVIESTRKYNIIGILDLPSEVGKSVLNYKILGDDSEYRKYNDLNYSFLITTGQIKTAKVRKRIYQELEDINASIETIISPSAIVSKYASIGKGSIIMHQCIVNAGAKIGHNCIINSGAIIEHDALIGENCHISTNSIVNGDVKVGSGSFIGSNSCISNGVHISDDVILGAGSTVIKAISVKGTYVGSPCKKT